MGKLSELRTKLLAKLHGHKNLLPAAGVAAGVVAAYAAVALLHRGSGTTTTPTVSAPSVTTDLGYGSGMPAYGLPLTAMPIGTQTPVGGGGYDPVMPVATPAQVANPGTIAASPPPAPKVAAPRAAAPPPAGQSAGPVAPPSNSGSSYATTPGTVTPVGHAPVQMTIAGTTVTTTPQVKAAVVTSMAAHAADVARSAAANRAAAAATAAAVKKAQAAHAADVARSAAANRAAAAKVTAAAAAKAAAAKAAAASKAAAVKSGHPRAL